MARGLLNGDDRLFLLGALVPLALDGEEVGVAADGDAAEGGVGRVVRVAGRVGGREEAAGEAVGQGGLADAGGAGEQPGVVHAAGADGVLEGGFGGLVAEQDRVFAGG